MKTRFVVPCLLAVMAAFGARGYGAGETVRAGGAGGTVSIWNANEKQMVAYMPLSTGAKAGDWVYVDSRVLHPTQFCLGYREVEFKAKMFSAMAADAASQDAKASTFPYLAKKDIPIIIGPDGTAYLTDGHHTLAALIDSTQSDKTAFGHIVANFFGKPQADFVAYMTDAKNNVTYLAGPRGNGLLNVPGPLPFEQLPRAVYSSSPAGRMADDLYRSLGWAMKDVAYDSKPPAGVEDDLFENFIEFRWADLLRDKIVWNNASDDSFYLAVANADALAHSELTTDMAGSITARDLPGFVAGKRSGFYPLNITNDTRILGDIAPPPLATNTLAINANADSTLIVAGAMSNLYLVAVNAGGTVKLSIEKNSLTPEVAIPAGSGTVIFTGESGYDGVTTVAAGTLCLNGSIRHSPMDLHGGATLSGSGHAEAIAGAGTISPGTTTGILTATSVEPAAGMGMALEFTGVEPDFSHPLRSRNDVLAITDETPFIKPLVASNAIHLFLRMEMPKSGDTFTGGIFAPTDFAPAIAHATIHAYIADPKGSVVQGATRYSAMEPGRVTLETVPITAAFAGGPQRGFITRVKINSAK